MRIVAGIGAHQAAGAPHQEAGGTHTNLSGDPALQPGSAVATNGLLHDEVLAALRLGSGQPEAE